MSSGRRRGRPKRKAQRRAQWQHEQRFSKRTKRQTPRSRDVFLMDDRAASFDDELWALALSVLHESERFPDGHPYSPYRKEA